MLDIEKYVENRKNFSIVGEYGIKYLDRYMKGILAEDFILIGAESGAGKSEVSNQIAFHNARNGKKVLYFALESEEFEPYKREVYRIIAKKYFKDVKEGKRINKIDMSYENYVTNSIDVDMYENGILEDVKKEAETLNIIYRNGHFDMNVLRKTIKENKADIIIVDHVDYFDLNIGENENAQVTEIMKEIRAINQDNKTPVLVVSHLRKKSDKNQIIPDMDSFHGSSNKVKQAKTVILLAPDYDMQDFKGGVYSTYIRVAKRRIGGASNIVAKCKFDRTINSYLDEYVLCKIKNFGTAVEIIPDEQYPSWAVDIKLPF